MPTIFLSYAHDDNLAPDDGRSKGWVSYFHDCLTIELKRLKDVDLWRDTSRFNDMGVVADKLREHVQNAELFLAVLSSRYKDKPYTRFELMEFFNAVAAEGDRDATEFVLPVLTRPLPEDEYPPPLRGMKYVEFFEIDRENNDVVPFYGGFGRVISDKYWKAIGEVGKFIELRLKNIDEAPAAQATAVYLAEPGRDQVGNHWNVYNELESQKCVVLPAEPWPVNAVEARAHLAAALKQAQFSVHLLGRASDNARRPGLADLAALQLDLAAERQRQDPGFRRLIWAPPALANADAAQQALIGSLEDGTRLTAKDEFVRSGIEAFVEEVRSEIARAAEPKG